jgi:tRNA nucleotidyltransferase (CCA-adding enzyme)
LACEADIKGRHGLESAPYPQADYLRALHQAVQSIDTRAICANEPDSRRIPQRLARARLQAIAEVRREWMAKQSH